MKTKLVHCGCGKHYVSAKNIVVFNGEDWDVTCAFHEQQTLLGKLRTEISAYQKKIAKLRTLERVVYAMKCPLCKKQLGKNYKLYGSRLYHLHCLHDIGGEG